MGNKQEVALKRALSKQQPFVRNYSLSLVWLVVLVVVVVRDSRENFVQKPFSLSSQPTNHLLVIQFHRNWLARRKVEM